MFETPKENNKNATRFAHFSILLAFARSTIHWIDITSEGMQRKRVKRADLSAFMEVSSSKDYLIRQAKKSRTIKKEGG